MMRRILPVAYFLLLSSFCFCQPAKELDSLLKTIDTQKEDSHAVSSLYRVALHYNDNNPSKALEYYERAEVLALRLNNDKVQLGDIYSAMGLIYLQRNDFDKALQYYLKSATLYEALNDNRRLSNAYMSVGKVFFWNKSFTKSNEYYDKAALIAEQQKDSTQISSLFSQRAMIHAEQGNFDTALYYFQAAATILEKTKDSTDLLNNLSNIGLTYLMKKDPARALHYFYLVLNAYDSSTATLLDYASIYNNIAAAESKSGHYAAAIMAFDKSNVYAIKDNIPYILMENYRNMSDMYAGMKNYQLQSVYLEKYYHLKDSIFTIDNKNQLTQLETDYQLGKKDISLIRQQAATASNKNQRNIFIIITIAAALLLAVLVFFYRRIRHNNLVLQEKNQQINAQKDELQTLNQVKDRLFSVISHDLRNPLVTLKTYLSLADNPSLAEEKKEQYKKQTQQAVNQTSDMLDNLLVWANMQVKNSSPAISVINLADCIDDAMSAVLLLAKQKNITISRNIAAPAVTGDAHIIEIALRNIITNAIKYSRPGNVVSISTSHAGDHLQLIVKDNGIGMSQEQIKRILDSEIESTPGTQGEKGSGLGLFLVKELLARINATLSIESEPGEGSSFIIGFTG